MSNIITTAELDAFTNKTNNAAQAADVVNAVNAYIAQQTGRSFGAVLTVTDELHDYKPTIWLNHMDIVAITTVKIGRPNVTRQTIAADAYWVNQYGRLVLAIAPPVNPSPYLYDMVVVTYTYGIAVVPDDLKLAALQLAQQYLNNVANSGQLVTMAMLGTYRLTYAEAKGMGAVIDSYKIKRF